MAAKADAESWSEFEKLAIDDHSRSNHRSGLAAEYDPAKYFQGDTSDKGKSIDTLRNEGIEDGTIDIAIRQALMDPKERTTVLRIEDQVEKFIQDSDRDELEFPNNFSNYQRMLAHRVSQYYGLQTSVKDGFQEGPGRVVAKKTEHMRVPQTKLADLKSALHSRAAERSVGPKVLQRRPGGNDVVKLAHSSNANTPSPALSMKVREEEYNEARERIGLGKTGDSSSSSSGGKSKQPTAKMSNGTLRPTPNNNAARNTQRKAVIRDKEKDLQDPDYKRGLNRFNSGFDGYPSGQGSPLYSMPVYPGEVPMPKPPASPTSSTNSHAFRPEFHQWNSSNSNFRPPPPPPPQPSSTSPKPFLPPPGPHHPMAAMARPMMAYAAAYPGMPGMHFAPGMAVPPQGMYSHPSMHMAYPMMPGYAFVPPAQDAMHVPAVHMYPGFNPAGYHHGFPPATHPGMPRAPMPVGMHMMMGMPSHFHMDLAHGMAGFGVDRGSVHSSRQISSGSSSANHAAANSHVSIHQIDEADSKSA